VVILTTTYLFNHSLIYLFITYNTHYYRPTALKSHLNKRAEKVVDEGENLIYGLLIMYILFIGNVGS
jgi:hypothetical protein